MGDEREIKVFTEHCIFMRSVFLHEKTIYKDLEREEFERIITSRMPSFFGDLGSVLHQFLIVEACKITDPAKGPATKGSSERPDNHTIEFLLAHYDLSPAAEKRLTPLRDSINRFRKKVKVYRNKLGSHSDREAVLSGKPLTDIDPADWDRFWTDLDELVNILHEEILGEPLHINDISAGMTDAGILLNALYHFAEATAPPRRGTS
jgi:hypothetical protein